MPLFPSLPPRRLRPAGSAPIAGLLETCRRPLWLGDATKLLFLGSAGHTPATEQFRHLRSRLSEIGSRRTLRSVVISSPLPSEGKTFLAANLAHAFARQHDRKILLVDADLRHSRLHALLGAPAEPGLSEYLRGTASDEQILQRGPQENLFFVPAGKAASNPGELIAGGNLKKLLGRLAPLFDWILLDTPSVVDSEGRKVAAVHDAGLVAAVCDAVLLVIHAGATPRDAAQIAAREFPGDRLLGVVLNRADNARRDGSGHSPGNQ
jgi:capsular exopolysaccharide synthesis family protein